MKTTKKIKRKKQTIIGKQEYINSNTGEIIECLVVEKQVQSDFNFHKVWIQDLMSILDLIGGKKILVLNYLLSKMRSTDNTISITYRKIKEDLNISLQTINDTMKILQENNFIKKIQNGLYMVNPDILVKGNSGKKQHLLIQYTQIENKD